MSALDDSAIDLKVVHFTGLSPIAYERERYVNSLETQLRTGTSDGGHHG